ncbi:hypothetical protein CHUAL_001361 [Chamberlinius hualienensis]
MSNEDRLGLLENEILPSDDVDETPASSSRVHGSLSSVGRQNNDDDGSGLGATAYTIEGDMYGSPCRLFNHRILLWNNNFDFRHVWLAGLLAILSTLTAVLFPSYVNAANNHSDAYCAILFCSIMSTILVAIVVMCFKLWDHSLRLKPPVTYKWLIPMSVLYGICGLVIFYARDRNRVLCHLQDPLAAIILPASVFFHLFQSKVDKICKLVCMAVAIIGLFICVDFQIWDEFSCHGEIATSALDDGQGWSSNTHVVWTFFYIASLIVLGYFYVAIDKEIRIFTDRSCSSIPLEGMSRNIDAGYERPSTSEENLFTLPTVMVVKPYSSQKSRFGNTIVLLFWVQLLSMVTIVLLFWTDLVSAIGKAGSTVNFRSYMEAGWNCYFGVETGEVVRHCSVTALYSWIFVFSYTLLIGVLLYAMTVCSQCSVAYIIGIKALSLPLSIVVWSFIETGVRWQWAPVFSGETGFTVVGLPIMIGALVLYKYYSDREIIQTDHMYVFGHESIIDKLSVMSINLKTLEEKLVWIRNPSMCLDLNTGIPKQTLFQTVADGTDIICFRSEYKALIVFSTVNNVWRKVKHKEDKETCIRRTSLLKVVKIAKCLRLTINLTAYQ